MAKTQSNSGHLENASVLKYLGWGNWTFEHLIGFMMWVMIPLHVYREKPPSPKQRENSHLHHSCLLSKLDIKMNKLRWKIYINLILNMTPKFFVYKIHMDMIVFFKTLHELAVTISLTRVALLSFSFIVLQP